MASTGADREWAQTRLSALVESTPDAIVGVGVDGAIETWNAAAAGLYGYSREEAIGQQVAILWPPEIATWRAAAVARAHAGETVRFQTQDLCKDGARVHVALTLSPIRDADGRLTGVGRIARDIGAERDDQAQLALRAAIIESMADGVILVRASDQRIVYTNPRFDAMFGYDAGELIGSAIGVVSAPGSGDDHAAAVAEITASLRRQGSWHGEVRNAKRDGTEFWCLANITRLEHPDHGLVWVSVHTDITERKLVDERLREAHQRFEHAFENAPIGMALIDLEGHWTRVNPALAQITGYSREQMLDGMTFQDITHPDDLESDLENLRRLLSGEAPDYQLEMRYFDAQGHVVWVMLARSLVRDAAGEPLYFVAQVEDISERKRVEDRLRQRADRDPLTGLRNRTVFERDLAIQLARCQRYGETAALLMIDLDGFKQINDTHGHKTGDDVLRGVAQALAERLRATDPVARIGGDEFAALLIHTGFEQAEAIADDVRRAIGTVRVLVGEHEIHPRASVGMAYLDDGAADSEQVMVAADEAMYSAKHARSNGARQEAPAARSGGSAGAGRSGGPHQLGRGKATIVFAPRPKRAD